MLGMSVRSQDVLVFFCYINFTVHSCIGPSNTFHFQCGSYQRSALYTVMILALLYTVDYLQISFQFQVLLTLSRVSFQQSATEPKKGFLHFLKRSRSKSVPVDQQLTQDNIYKRKVSMSYRLIILTSHATSTPAQYFHFYPEKHLNSFTMVHITKPAQF